MLELSAGRRPEGGCLCELVAETLTDQREDGEHDEWELLADEMDEDADPVGVVDGQRD